MSTRAFRTLDCAQKIRVHYHLPRSIDKTFLFGLPTTELEIQEFSKLVSGAKDHFRATCARDWSATGVLGEHKLIVTYGKFGGPDEDAEANILILEAALETLGCGPLVQCAGVNGADEPIRTRPE